jgi:hypothetical protein
MTKLISLDIPEDIYEKLVSLCSFDEQNLKETVLNILQTISSKSESFIRLGQEYKGRMNLAGVISDVLEAGMTVTYMLFNPILEALETKGRYSLNDFGFDLDKGVISVSFCALKGCKLLVNEFYLNIERGISRNTYYSIIEVEKYSEANLRKLKKIVENYELPEEFQDEFDELEDYFIEVDSDDEEYWRLLIDCTADSLQCLPKVERVSALLKTLFRKSGITKIR